MGKLNKLDLKYLFKQAAEIAQQVPESMQEAAFNRAIDLLTRDSHTEKKTDIQDNPSKIIKQNAQKESDNNSSKDLFELIDSTKHPNIKNTNKVLDNALLILQIALREHSVDGLKPSLIAKILTDKFRISTGNNAVSMALGKATNLVNRIPDGGGFVYKIMTSGEEYLAEYKTKDGNQSSTGKSKPKKKSAKKYPPSNAEVDTKKSKNKTKKSKNNAGIKESIISLIDSGYFDNGKTAPEVKLFLKNKRGITFSTAQLRMAMLRLVRDEKLDRDLNEEKQYEYTKS